MKTKNNPLTKRQVNEAKVVQQAIPLARAKEIMIEEGIEYTDEELKEVLQFITKVISIATGHYERLKEKEAKVISINTITTHETKSIPLHPCKHRRAS